MANHEIPQPQKTGSNELAKIIIYDTILNLNGDTEKLNRTISAITGENGDQLTQAVLNDYYGIGTNGTFDKRALGINPLNVNTNGLKIEMTTLLQTYAQLPENERENFLEGLNPNPHQDQ